MITVVPPIGEPGAQAIASSVRSVNFESGSSVLSGIDGICDEPVEVDPVVAGDLDVGEG